MTRRNHRNRARDFRERPHRRDLRTISKLASVARKRKLERLILTEYRKDAHGERRQFATLQEGGSPGF